MAPYMLAWSVRAIARIPCALARLASSSSFTALVRNEYCEWTCRWTNSRATSPWLTTHRKRRGARARRPSLRPLDRKILQRDGHFQLNRTAARAVYRPRIVARRAPALASRWGFGLAVSPIV